MAAVEGATAGHHQKQEEVPHNLGPPERQVWPILPNSPCECFSQFKTCLEDSLFSLLFACTSQTFPGSFTYVYHGEPLDSAAKTKLAEEFAAFLAVRPMRAPQTPKKRTKVDKGELPDSGKKKGVKYPASNVIYLPTENDIVVPVVLYTKVGRSQLTLVTSPELHAIGLGAT